MKHIGERARHKLSWLWCEAHGKRGFHHKKAAKLVARETDHSCRMSVFKCYETDTWHTGHLRDGIKRGVYSRDDLLNRPRRDQS